MMECCDLTELITAVDRVGSILEIFTVFAGAGLFVLAILADSVRRKRRYHKTQNAHTAVL